MVENYAVIDCLIDLDRVSEYSVGQVGFRVANYRPGTHTERSRPCCTPYIVTLLYWMSRGLILVYRVTRRSPGRIFAWGPMSVVKPGDLWFCCYSAVSSNDRLYGRVFTCRPYVLGPSPGAYYIPHHAICRSSDTDIEIHVVFDASAKSFSGLSLNYCLLVWNSSAMSLTY